MNFKQMVCEVARLTEVAQIRAQHRSLDNTVNFPQDGAFPEQLSCYWLRQKLYVTDGDYLLLNV